MDTMEIMETSEKMASERTEISRLASTPPQQLVVAPSQIRPKWGNPAPLTMLGLCMSLSCISLDLLGWRGSSSGAATTGTYFFVGGVLMVIAGVLEFFSGNTFPFVISCGFGGFWLTMGATFTPGFGSWAAYSSDPVGNPYQGLSDPGFLASFAWFFLCMALLSFIGLICALKSNVPNVICFLFLVIQYCLLAGSYWTQAEGQEALALNVQVAAGAAGFVVVSAGWYLFASLMLEAADSPLRLPVGDLSRFFKNNREYYTEGISTNV